MVDLLFEIKKDKYIEELLEARKRARSSADFEDAAFGWLKQNLVLTLEDEFMMVDTENGWVSISYSEITPEMLVAFIESKPKLATKEVFKAMFDALDKEEEVSK